MVERGEGRLEFGKGGGPLLREQAGSDRLGEKGGSLNTGGIYKLKKRQPESVLMAAGEIFF